jgi:hypothetical protein
MLSQSQSTETVGMLLSLPNAILSDATAVLQTNTDALGLRNSSNVAPKMDLAKGLLDSS